MDEWRTDQKDCQPLTRNSKACDHVPGGRRSHRQVPEVICRRCRTTIHRADSRQVRGTRRSQQNSPLRVPRAARVLRRRQHGFQRQLACSTARSSTMKDPLKKIRNPKPKPQTLNPKSPGMASYRPRKSAQRGPSPRSSRTPRCIWGRGVLKGLRYLGLGSRFLSSTLLPF